MKTDFDDLEIEKTIRAMHTFLNPINVKIIKLLEQNEVLRKGEIADILKLKYDNIGRNLSIMAKHHILIRVWKNSTWYYKLDKEILEKAQDIIKLFGKIYYFPTRPL